MIKNIRDEREGDERARPKPSILSKPENTRNVVEDRKHVTSLVGTAKLSLPCHADLLSLTLGQAGGLTLQPDVQLLLADGRLATQAILLAGISPFLKGLLEEAWEQEEFPVVLSLPEVTRQQMGLLLSLLYTGQANLFQGELSDLVSLTHLLKLVSIPVAIQEEKWDKRETELPATHPKSKAVITFLPSEGTARGRPAKMLTSLPPEKVQSPVKQKVEFKRQFFEEIKLESCDRITQVEYHSTQLITGTDPKSEAQDINSLETESESDEEEFVEEMQVFVSQEGEVERLELLGHDDDFEHGRIYVQIDHGDLREVGTESHSVQESKVEEVLVGETVTLLNADDDEMTTATVDDMEESGTRIEPMQTDTQTGESAGQATTVTVLQAEDGEGLDSLISVAEAFEKSQQPDFNDIASPVVDGTDTDKHLVRNCAICNKSLLGRNALGRHMKNVHPKVFGPYRCSFLGCAKMVESGVKMLTHMYHHTGGKTKVAQETPSFACSVPRCDEVFASGSRLAEHMKRDHEMLNPALQKTNFPCNAGLSSGCCEVFTTARNFIKHMKESHEMKPWYCSSCDKRFMERQNLQFHLMSHGNKKNFNCDICNKSFANPRQLYTHRALHLGKRFLCQECGYRARSSANLRGHVRSKHEARSHNCHLCQKKFSSGNNLRNHLRIHTGETPYECELCGVKFKRMHHLHSHIESKMHIDVMEKCRRKGHPIPQRLDPIRRARGRPMVEDGPVTLVTQAQFETHIAEISEGEGSWPTHQVVVVEESVGDFVIPVEDTQVEIIQESAAMHEGTYTFAV